MDKTSEVDPRPSPDSRARARPVQRCRPTIRRSPQPPPTAATATQECAAVPPRQGTQTQRPRDGGGGSTREHLTCRESTWAGHLEAPLVVRRSACGQSGGQAPVGFRLIYSSIAPLIQPKVPPEGGGIVRAAWKEGVECRLLAQRLPCLESCGPGRVRLRLTGPPEIPDASRQG
jgi:hypothetical protein